MSDHFPIVLEWIGQQNPRAYPFKFNHTWLDNEDFVQMVRSEWSHIQPDPSQDAMNDLSCRLRILKDKVKSWTKSEALKMKDKSAALEEEISSLLHSSVSAILNYEQQLKLCSLKAALQKLSDHEISTTRLKSRITGALKGDANTKYFHAVATARKNQNAIWSLKDEMGTWVSDDQSLKALGIKHFKTMFEDDKMTNLESPLNVIRLFPTYISMEDKYSFSRPISIQEVEKALKLFKKDKAPGPDGW